MITQQKTQVRGMEEKEEIQIKRKRLFLFLFPLEWWETISTEHIGNDIYIKTNREIRIVYLNGKPLNK